MSLFCKKFTVFRPACFSTGRPFSVEKCKTAAEGDLSPLPPTILLCFRYAPPKNSPTATTLIRNPTTSAVSEALRLYRVSRTRVAPK